MTGRDLDARGTYRPCPACQAPVINPPPADTEIELIKEGPPEGPARTYVTPHSAGCTAPYADPQTGVTLRLPAAAVASLTFLPPPIQHSPVRTDLWWNHPDMDPEGVRRDAHAAAQREAARPVEPVDLTGFTPLGTATGWAITDLTEGQAVQSVTTGDGELYFKPAVPHALDGRVLTTEGTLPPDAAPLLFGVDSSERLPGETVSEALGRLGLTGVVRDAGEPQP